jgi:hypothetical protein
MEETDGAKMRSLSSMHLLNSNRRCHPVLLEAAAAICHWLFATRSELPIIWVHRWAVGVACSQARHRGPRLEPHRAHLSRPPAAMAARLLMPPPICLGRGWLLAHRWGTWPPNRWWWRSRDTRYQIHGGLGVGHRRGCWCITHHDGWIQSPWSHRHDPTLLLDRRITYSKSWCHTRISVLSLLIYIHPTAHACWGGVWACTRCYHPRIEKPVWSWKPLTTGMTGYHKNRSKTALNSNFTFNKSRIGKPIDMTGLPIGMTDKPVLKSINRSVGNG